MELRQFTVALAIFAAFNVLGVLYLERLNPDYSPQLSIVLIGFFTVLNQIVFMLAKRYSDQSNDKKYLGLVFKNFLLKLLVVVAIPFIYIKTGGEKNSFIIPYTLVYVSFTIFETYYLNKTAVIRR